MSFFDYVNKRNLNEFEDRSKTMEYSSTDSDETSVATLATFVPTMTDKEYFEIVDPSSGYRYTIPNLNQDSFEYFAEYVSYMKLKEHKPALFDKIMSWD